MSYHQSAGEALRSRSVVKGREGEVQVRGYQPYNAVLLHTQLVERGLAAGPAEFVTPTQCRRLGGSVFPSAQAEEDRFLVETGDRRGIAVRIAGSPGVLQRPGAYYVLHADTQTDLPPMRDPRAVSGAGAAPAAEDLVRQVIRASGVRLAPLGPGAPFARDGEGLVISAPGRRTSEPVSAWASAVVAAVAAAVSDDESTHHDVRMARLERDALREHNGRAARAKSGVAVEPHTDEAAAVTSRALGALYGRAAGVLARREGVRVDFDRPAGEGLFDAASRSFRPRAARLFQAHGGRQSELFQQAVLTGLCAHVGTPEERRAASALGKSVPLSDRRLALGLVEQLAGGLPGLDRRPRLSSDDRVARALMVGQLAARPLVESAGLPYVPSSSNEDVDRRQAAVVRAEGLRSLCADAGNVGAWVLDRDRNRSPVVPVEREAGVGDAAHALGAVAPPRARARQQELSW